jgi:hypothetical protein
MKVKELKLNDYIKLFDKTKQSLRVCMDEIQVWPGMTEQEREDAIYKAFNPDLPLFIDVLDEEGVTRYIQVKE